MPLKIIDIRDGSHLSPEDDAAITDGLSKDGAIDIGSLPKSYVEKLEHKKSELDSDGETLIKGAMSEMRFNPEVKRHDIERDLDLTNPHYLPPSPLLEEWGPGARAEVIVFWKDNPDSGHAFMAENDDGKVRFIDPQSADEDCSWYFDNVAEDETRFWRTDNIEPSVWMDECCKECNVDDYLQ